MNNNDVVPLTLKSLEFESQWGDPVDFEHTDERILNIKLVDDARSDLLTQMAIGISKQVQFPKNSAFLHGLGIIATAMTKSFSYSYRGSNAPVNLYVVTSQPPSTGKSGVNNLFVAPVRVAFNDFNDSQKKKRGKIEHQIKDAKTELKASNNDLEVDTLIAQISDLEAELESKPIYKYSVSNTTPEALEQVAFNQLGTWNLISDEAGSINVLLGNMYSDNAMTNADIVLQSWDGDWLSVARITRKTGDGYVRGSIAVIAQDETISTILDAGIKGNGVSERFLLLRENDMLGYRDHTSYIPLCESVKVSYSALINQLVFSENTVFKFDDCASDLIMKNKVKIEPHMKENGMYSNNLLRGVVGKMDKQVMKIACVLHVVEHWGNGLKPLYINADTVKWAIKLYKELIKLYIDAADSNGFIGEVSEIKAIKEQFAKFVQKGKFAVTPTELKDFVKRKSVFRGRTKLAGYIKDKLLIKCIELRLCTLHDGKIAINPKLR